MHTFVDLVWHSRKERFDSITPLLVDGILVAREIFFAPQRPTYLRLL